MSEVARLKAGNFIFAMVHCFRKTSENDIKDSGIKHLAHAILIFLFPECRSKYPT